MNNRDISRNSCHWNSPPQSSGESDSAEGFANVLPAYPVSPEARGNVLTGIHLNLNLSLSLKSPLPLECP